MPPLLIKINTPITASITKKLTKSKKIYINDISLLNSLMKYSDININDSTIQGKIAETLVAIHLDTNLFYRDIQKREIDDLLDLTKFEFEIFEYIVKNDEKWFTTSELSKRLN